MSRRGFVRTMVGLGFTAPMAGMLLVHHGVAMAQPLVSAYKPTKRGGGGALKLLWWQGPTLLNPHLAQQAPARPRSLHDAVREHGSVVEGEQVAGPQHLALEERGARPRLSRGGEASWTR